MHRPIGVMILVGVRVFAADVPEYINYQGLLAKDGVAVNGQRIQTYIDL